MKCLLLVFALAAGSGCTQGPDKIVQLLEAQGFTKVQKKGYDFFGCSEDDEFRTKFEAIGPTGKPVSGTVCSGILKKATIRFD
jgi:hypothetical protein